MVDADRQRKGGRRVDGYTISSSCEPNGSGELIMRRMKKKGYSYNLIMLRNIPYHIYNGRAEKYTYNAHTFPYNSISIPE